MIYVGSRMSAPQGFGDTADPALINPGLMAHAERLDRGGQHLDYWPSYSKIPRSSRAAYLDWLATGRRDPDVAAGYVFLFFYGLERRILLDMEESQEARKDLSTILGEIEALREVYAEQSRSFDGYSRRLLGFARLKRDGLPGTNASPAATSRGHGIGLANKLSLGAFVYEGKPIPPEWALTWLRGSPHHRLKTPGHRCRDMFDQLFKERYSACFPGGLTIEGKRPLLEATYQPATSAIREIRGIELEGVTDIDHCSFPDSLSQLADGVEASLDSYSRWIGRRADRSSPAAIGQLPPSLVKKQADEESRALAREIGGKLKETDYAVVPSDWITERWPSKNKGRLTKTEAEGLSGFLAGFGYGIEPDVRHTRNPAKRDHVTLFRLDGEDEPPGEGFEAARLLLHLAAAVAGADEEVTEREERHIEEHLEKSLGLSRAERRRLRAHLERQLAHPPTLRGVRRRAEKLDVERRRQLATYLLTVAGADGQIQGEELKVLEKIYDTLGLEEDKVHQDLHRMSSRSPMGRPDEGPVTVIEAQRDSGDYEIAEELEASADAPEEKEASGIALDLDRVKNVQRETRDVARALGDVFEEDEQEEEVLAIESLSAEHEALVGVLRARKSWPREEFDRVAEEHGLMPGFAIEGINDAAFERAGEPLLEGENPIEINLHAHEVLES